MIHYMLLPGYLPTTYHKNNIVTLLITSMLYYRNITCLLGKFQFLYIWPAILDSSY